VVGGSFVALLALFHHTRISTAALRGGLTYLAVLLLARLGFAALQHARMMDEVARIKEEETSG